MIVGIEHHDRIGRGSQRGGQAPALLFDALEELDTLESRDDLGRQRLEQHPIVLLERVGFDAVYAHHPADARVPEHRHSQPTGERAAGHFAGDVRGLPARRHLLRREADLGRRETGLIDAGLAD